MPRAARIVVPGTIHHVTQRGNNRQAVFLGDEDRFEYLDSLRFECERRGVAVFGYCLMSNHVHLLLRPEKKDGLALVLRGAHSEYAQWFNQRGGRSGHLWQNRYFSSPLTGRHVLNALRYVDLNPVRAGLVGDARWWRWSSAAGHCRGEIDEFGLMTREWTGWRDWPGDWAGFLAAEDREGEEGLRQHLEGRGRGRPQKAAVSEKRAPSPFSLQ